MVTRDYNAVPQHKYFKNDWESQHTISSPECPPHSLIIHIWLVLVFAPQLGHSLGVDQFEDTLLPLCPLDVPGTRILVLKKVQQELP